MRLEREKNGASLQGVVDAMARLPSPVATTKNSVCRWELDRCVPTVVALRAYAEALGIGHRPLLRLHPGVRAVRQAVRA